MHLDTTKPVGRRLLLTGGLAALSIPVLSACAPDTGTQSQPRTSAAPSGTAASAPSASGSGSASASAPTASVKVSTTLDDITVTGAANAAPTIKVPSPWAIDATKVKVLSPGDGATVQAGAPITIQYTGVDARTGEKFDSSWDRGEPATFSLDGVIAGFAKGLEGQKVGSRVVIGITGPDGYDASGGNPTAGILVGDTLIFVVDILATLLSGPSGATVAPVEGLPTVADSNGTPTITMPQAEPPTELKIQPLIKGTGAVVKESDQVHLHYRGAVWADGKVVDDNYGKASEATALGATLITGFTKGIIGQTVGSRMLLVIPPAEGYPEGNATPAVPKGATLVYVVDILFAQAAQ